jgi:hypothetical protein
MRGRWARDLLTGLGAGYGATRVMEKASTFMYERQSEEARNREEELREEMPTTVLVRKVADWRGVKLEDEQADRLGTWLHYGFGAAGGPVAAILARTTAIRPLRAGLAVGTAMFVLVDEGANYVLGLTPPAPEWPAVTHLGPWRPTWCTDWPSDRSWPWRVGSRVAEADQRKPGLTRTESTGSGSAPPLR